MSIWAAPDRPGAGTPPNPPVSLTSPVSLTPPVPPAGVPRAAGGAGPPVRITLPPGFSPNQAPRPAAAGPSTVVRTPSGLFPSGPPRPVYREAHPTRFGQVVLGAVAGTLWMLLFGLLAGDARGYIRWSLAAGLLAWAGAVGLARFGIRGIAVGVALTTGLGMAVAGVILTEHWAGGHWLLW